MTYASETRSIAVVAKITDVAKHAGVSASTVSHVLSGNRPISETTKRRVLDAIEALGYHPNPNARALKSKQSGIIGFYAGDITELFVTEIIRGVESVIVPRDEHLLLVSGAEFHGDTEKALRFLDSRRVDGLIISYGVSQHKRRSIEIPGDRPTITINSHLGSSIPSIEPDNHQGGRDAAAQLFAAGARRIAVIAGPKTRLASKKRLEGLFDFEPPPDRVLLRDRVEHVEFTFEGGYRGMKRLLENGKDFDALFCANDYIAAGAMTAADEAGISIPQELLVVGFDDREFAAFWPTPISTFKQPLFRMGQLAAQYLTDCIYENQGIPSSTLLQSEFIRRKSSTR